MAIKKILALFALFILSTPAFAQGFGSPNGVGFPSTSSGSGSSPLTTKGDVFTFSTVNTRLPVGTNGQLLSADSSQATGLKWITASGTGTVTSVSGLAPLFTTANSTTTPTFSLSNAAAHAFFGNNTGSSAAPSYVQPAFTDLSGQATFAQFPTLSSGNIIVGNGSNVAASVAMSGDATISNGGAVTIANNAVTNAKAAQMAAHTYKGNNTGSTANAADITNTQLTADLDTFTSSLKGLAPASGGGTTNFLRADGSWAAPAGGGSGVPSTKGILGVTVNDTRNTSQTTASSIGVSPAVGIGDGLNVPKLRNAVANIKAAQQLNPPCFLCIGDSITANGGNNPQAPPQQIAYRFQGAGVNTIINGYRWTAGADQGPSDWTYGTGWTNAGGFGPRQLSGARAVAGATSGNLTFTKPSTMTGATAEPNGNGTIILYTCTSTGASASVEIPSGFPVTTLTPTAGTISAYILQGNGPNFVVKPPTGTGDIVIVGACPLPGTNGSGIWDKCPNALIVSNCGSSGTTSADWLPGFSSFITSIKNATSLPIVSLALGKNDMITGVSASTWSTNMQTLITAVKTAGADCVIVLPNPSNPATYPGIGAVEQQYRAAAIALANTNNCILIDNIGRMVDYATAVANGFMSGADNIHPTTSGYYDEAQAEFEPLAEAVGMRGSQTSIDLASQVGGVLDGSSRINLLSPPVIGFTTPNIGYFSGLHNSVSQDNDAAGTTVAGSAGNLIWTQPQRGLGHKKIVVSLNGYTAAGTTVINYPTAFTRTPSVFLGLSVNTLTGATTTASALTLPAMTTQTGTVLVEGF